MIEQAVATWHEIVEGKKLDLLDDLLADDCVFYSPVVFQPQRGKALTQMYLAAAYDVLFKEANFQYQREVMSGNNAVLEFTAELEGTVVNGVDIITCNDDGKIAEFKVMVRPLRAINLLHQKMKEMLESLNAL